MDVAILVPELVRWDDVVGVIVVAALEVSVVPDRGSFETYGLLSELVEWQIRTFSLTVARVRAPIVTAGNAASAARVPTSRDAATMCGHRRR